MDFSFSEIAEKDLENILDYFINKLFNKQAAKNFYEKVCNVIENIESFPEMYELVSNDFIKCSNVRRVPIDNFNLYYRAEHETNKITIIRIIYAHYNLKPTLENN